MARSEADVCNVALARVGQRQFLADLRSDDSEPADLCRAVFDNVRDLVLEELDWPFARRRMVLSPLTNVTRTAWANVFTLPADCLAPRSIDPGERVVQAAQRVPFSIESDAVVGTTVLLCDYPAPELRYTSNAAQILQPTIWPAKFADAVSWALAVELCLSLPIKPNVAMAMDRGYQRALLQARAVVFGEQQEDQPPDAESVTARQ